MRGRIAHPGVLGFGLIVLCAILIVVISFQVYQGLSVVYADERVVSTKSDPTSSPLPSATISFSPLQQYAEIVERPLFDVSRRLPPPETKSTSVAATKLRQLRLTGVVITPEKNLAILRDKNPREMIRLEQGMTVGGWSLEEIRANGITFRMGAATHELLLHEKKDQASATGRGARRKLKGRAR